MMETCKDWNNPNVFHISREDMKRIRSLQDHNAQLAAQLVERETRLKSYEDYMLKLAGLFPGTELTELLKKGLIETQLSPNTATRILELARAAYKNYEDGFENPGIIADACDALTPEDLKLIEVEPC